MIGGIRFKVFDCVELYIPAHVGNCTICEDEHVVARWLPMYEGRVVDIAQAKEDDEYAWMPVCEGCFEPHKEVGAKLAVGIAGVWYT